jgi:hypothetical protein
MYDTARTRLALVLLGTLSGIALLTGCPIFGPGERARDHQRSDELESTPREDDHHQGQDHR